MMSCCLTYAGECIDHHVLVEFKANRVAKAFNDMSPWGGKRRERRAFGDESSGNDGESAAAADACARRFDRRLGH